MIRFSVNGALQQVDDGRGADTLLDFLHDDLGLTGSKLCCGIGVCRACTVSVAKGENPTQVPVIACSTPLSTLDDCRITTVEGLAPPGQVTDIQQAFLSEFAFQCGYCTPGFVMAASILLDRLARDPVPADRLEHEIAGAIGPHICRCTGYVRYHAALSRVAAQVNAGAS
ncbi:MAG: 2Fe-2S iron-sulfur cluster-binding protein [Gemmobacter sp.]|nr:2Fe-2S iron-sulfur cluster-binding protein [Gemmobacter sp.]